MAKKVTMITEVVFDKAYELSYDWYDNQVLLVEVDGEENIMVIKSDGFYYKVEDMETVVKIMRMTQSTYYISEYEVELKNVKEKAIKNSKTVYKVDEYRTVQRIKHEREEAEEQAKEVQEDVV